MCETCGMSMMFEGITLDHKIPRVLHKYYSGNIHETDNLELICPSCNSLKGQRTLVEFLEELRARNEHILMLSQKNNHKNEIISPIYPRIGYGLSMFGDRSAKKFRKSKTPLEGKEPRHIKHWKPKPNSKP